MPLPAPRLFRPLLAFASVCLVAALLPGRLAAQSNQGTRPVGPNPQPDPALNLGATLYAYGSAAGDAAAAQSDDSFTLYSLANAGPLGSTLSFPFLQTHATNLYVNNNGLISINGAVSTWSAANFPINNIPIIAPFWADVDTTGANAGTVWYRTAQDAPTLQALGAQIESSFAGAQNFTPTFASIATWDSVGYYYKKADYVNTFQAVVASDGVRTYALFLYPNQGIWWLRGNSSTSDPGMGWNAGDGINFLNTTYSRTSAMADVWFLSNTDDNSPGVHAFRLDDGSAETRVVATDFTPAGGKLHASYLLRLGDLPSSGAQLHTVGANSVPIQFNQLVFDDPTETLWTASGLLIANAPNAINHGNIKITNTAQFVAQAAGAINGGNFTLQGFGELHVWVANALTANADLTFDNASSGAGGTGGILHLRGNSTTVGALTSHGIQAGVVTSSLPGASTLDLAGANSGDFNGRLEDGSGALYLVKSGTGTQTLSGTNTYTGSTTLSGGTLAVAADANLGASTAPILFSGGTLRANASFTTARETTLGTGGGTIAVAEGATLIWQSGITGAAGSALTKTGSGSLTLSGVNLYRGPTQIKEGTLVIGATGTIPDDSPVTIDLGATLDLADRQDAVGSVSGQGNIVLGNGTLVSGGDNTSTHFGGVISGAGNFTKLGAGSLTLSGPNTLSGVTTLSAGTLRTGATGALSSSSTLFLNNGATLDLNGFSQTVADLDSYNTTTGLFDPGTVQLGGATLINLTGVQNNWHGTLAGSGNFEKRGSALMVWSGANTFTGVLTVAEGTLATAAVDTLSPHASVAVATGATLALQDQAQTIAGLAGAGSVVLGAATLTTSQNTASTFSGVLTGSGGLTKIGSGSLTLTGTSTYTGATAVDAGKLVVNGSLATSAVTVNSGATLSGSGTVGPLALASGALLSPGNSPGTLSTGSQTWAGGATYVWEIDDATGTAGTNSDLLAISGTLTLTATSENKFTLALVSLLPNHAAGNVINFNPGIDASYTVASTTGGILGFHPSIFSIDASGFSNALNGGTWSLALANDDKDLALNFTAAIPEPSTYAAGLGALVFALAIYRQRRVRA